MTSIADAPETWSWPADVRERMARHRIAIPKDDPKSAEPPQSPAPEPTREDAEEALGYMYGCMGF